MNSLLSGAAAMGFWTVSLFFLRFWRQTRDRFFLLFAIAFFIEGADRIASGIATFPRAEEPSFYLARLFTYALIIVAIIDKNRNSARQQRQASSASRETDRAR